VVVDGRPVGSTPIELDLPLGKHTAVFTERDGARTKKVDFVARSGAPNVVEWNVRVKSGSAPAVDAAPVAPEKATLLLEATPFATRILVDGQQVAVKKSFHELEMSAGRHAIEFVIEDPSLTKTIKRAVELKAGTTEKVSINFLSD
jgi:hypothetical protein